MKVCIAEKPSVAREIASIVGATTKRDGYFEGNGYAVTYTFGHLCTLYEPNDYKAYWKSWDLNNLPMLPEKFKTKVVNDAGIKKQFDIVISNPPYIPKKEIPGLMKDVKEFEPKIALTDFNDGLTFYKRISKIIPHILKDDSSCILELGLGNHPEKVLSIFKESGYSNMEIFDDYNGDKRVLSIKA